MSGSTNSQRVNQPIFKRQSSCYGHGMTYVVTVPVGVGSALAEADPDVRSVVRLPGFVRLEQVDRDSSRYELTIEVEGGSVRDAMDAADELVVEYENALAVYPPRQLAAIAPELR